MQRNSTKKPNHHIGKKICSMCLLCCRPPLTSKYSLTLIVSTQTCAGSIVVWVSLLLCAGCMDPWESTGWYEFGYFCFYFKDCKCGLLDIILNMLRRFSDWKSKTAAGISHTMTMFLIQQSKVWKSPLQLVCVTINDNNISRL